MIEVPSANSVVVNPSNDELQRWALELMPRVTRTEFGNVNYQSMVTARLKDSTFFVADHEIHQNRMSRAEAEDWGRRQDEYIADKDMISTEGYIGPDPASRIGVRMLIEKIQPNIAGMQSQLYFPPDEDWSPDFTVSYTPGLSAPGKPDECLIIVDLENWITRVFGSDYFGESKMGGLRTVSYTHLTLPT